MKLFVRVAIGVFVLMGLAFGIAWAATEPPPLPEPTLSAARLQSGPHPVASQDFSWVDASRRTAKNGSFEGAPERRWPTAWTTSRVSSA